MASLSTIECAVCYWPFGEFARKPCIGTCGHSYCEICKDRMTTSNCPYCNSDAFRLKIYNNQVLDMLKILFIFQMAGQFTQNNELLFEEGICSECNSKKKQLRICVECGIKHGILKSDPKKRQMFCLNTEKLDDACFEARKIGICSDCLLAGKHKDHKIATFSVLELCVRQGILPKILSKLVEMFQIQIEKLKSVFETNGKIFKQCFEKGGTLTSHTERNAYFNKVNIVIKDIMQLLSDAIEKIQNETLTGTSTPQQSDINQRLDKGLNSSALTTSASNSAQTWFMNQFFNGEAENMSNNTSENENWNSSHDPINYQVLEELKAYTFAENNVNQLSEKTHVESMPEKVTADGLYETSQKSKKLINKLGELLLDAENKNEQYLQQVEQLATDAEKNCNNVDNRIKRTNERFAIISEIIKILETINHYLSSNSNSETGSKIELKYFETNKWVHLKNNIFDHSVFTLPSTIKCDRCSLEYDDIRKPYLGKCGHQICKTCYEGRSTDTCTYCNQEDSFINFIVNFTHLEIVKHFNITKYAPDSMEYVRALMATEKETLRNTATETNNSNDREIESFPDPNVLEQDYEIRQENANNQLEEIGVLNNMNEEERALQGGIDENNRIYPAENDGEDRNFDQIPEILHVEAMINETVGEGFEEKGICTNCLHHARILRTCVDCGARQGILGFDPADRTKFWLKTSIFEARKIAICSDCALGESHKDHTIVHFVKLKDMFGFRISA